MVEILLLSSPLLRMLALNASGTKLLKARSVDILQQRRRQQYDYRILPVILHGSMTNRVALKNCIIGHDESKFGRVIEV